MMNTVGVISSLLANMDKKSAELVAVELRKSLAFKKNKALRKEIKELDLSDLEEEDDLEPESARPEKPKWKVQKNGIVVQKEKFGKETVRVVGYWFSKDHPELPKPRPCTVPSWRRKFKRLFVARLMKFWERGANHGRVEHYKGWSNCRICREKNGSTELHYRGWVVPVGLLHYIREHNVRPPKEFRIWLKEWDEKRKAKSKS